MPRAASLRRSSSWLVIAAAPLAAVALARRSLIAFWRCSFIAISFKPGFALRAKTGKSVNSQRTKRRDAKGRHASCIKIHYSCINIHGANVKTAELAQVLVSCEKFDGQ